jgi:hypothetical protein
MRRTLVDVVDVRVEETRAASIEGARGIVVGVVTLRRIHRADAVGQPRELGEELGQLRVRALADVAVEHQALVGPVEEELLVLAREAQELVPRTLEVRRSDDLLHLRADALHLREADGVDFLGAHRGRRHLLHEGGVVARARGKRGRGELLARGRDVLLLRELPEPGERRVHAFGEDAPAAFRQPLAIGGGEIARERLERLP